MGFRWATLIDPLWNAVLLSRVIEIAEDLEKSRIGLDKNIVFSYRYKYDDKTGKMFDDKYNWRSFTEQCRSNANDINCKSVIKIDISDFYNRIYHHKLENSLKRSTVNLSAVSDIMKILQDISENASYGLPVGGNSARVLAEILLNPFDHMLQSKKIKYCRYVDDVVCFARSHEEAYHILTFCASYLLANEGLSLQKHKTQILNKEEYISHLSRDLSDADGDLAKQKKSLMSLHIHYDPYSPTAIDDYEGLKAEIAKHDIMSILKDELRKSQINLALGRQLLNAVRVLTPEEIGLTLMLIMNNIEVFYPIFPHVMILANSKLEEISEGHRSVFLSKLCELIESNSYIVYSDVNRSYAIRCLSRGAGENERLVQAIESTYSESNSDLVRANCLYSMYNRGEHYWIADKRRSFSSMGGSERRALIAGSYILGDEGKHWRSHIKDQMNWLEKEVAGWVSGKSPLETKWRLPI